MNGSSVQASATSASSKATASSSASWSLEGNGADPGSLTPVLPAPGGRRGRRRSSSVRTRSAEAVRHRRHHHLVGAGARHQLVEPFGHRGGVADDAVGRHRPRHLDVGVHGGLLRADAAVRRRPVRIASIASRAGPARCSASSSVSAASTPAVTMKYGSVEGDARCERAAVPARRHRPSRSRCRCRSGGRRRTAARAARRAGRSSRSSRAARSPATTWPPAWRGSGPTRRGRGARSPSRPIRSTSSAGKSSAPSPAGLRRSAAAVAGSVPGARPMPRSMRPGCSASSSANCSATTSGGWLGSITPPDPTRIVLVLAARWAISTAGDVLATVGMLWCSATQNRW